MTDCPTFPPQQGVAVLKAQLEMAKKGPALPGDRFIEVMDPFLVIAEAGEGKLASAFADCEAKAKEVIAHYCEDPAKVSTPTGYFLPNPADSLFLFRNRWESMSFSRKFWSSWCGSTEPRRRIRPEHSRRRRRERRRSELRSRRLQWQSAGPRSRITWLMTYLAR